MQSVGLRIPTEDEDHKELVRWLNLMNLPHHHSPNEMWTSSFKQKNRNVIMGVSAGWPDLVVVILPERSKDGIGRLVGVELKRIKGGTLTKSQSQWLELLNLTGVPSQRCNGLQEAIEYISGFLKKRG